MKEDEKSKKFTRRQVLKMTGAAAAGIAASSLARRIVKPVNIFASGKEKVATEPVPVSTTEADRKELAKKYANAKPGDKFGIGHIAWWLSQEYAIMNYQASQQAAEQLGCEFMGAVANIGTAIEKALGCPQDIEGAYRKGEYYVVQTRPQVGIEGE